MPYRWTEGYPRSENLVEATEHNRAMNSPVGELNGSLDRENLPAAGVTPVMVKKEAFFKYVLLNDIFLEDAMVQPYPAGVFDLVGTDYELYTGGWHTNSQYNIEDTFTEGMMHLEFSAWFWRSQEWSASGKVYCQFRLLYNGGVVTESDRIFTNMGNIVLTTDFAMPSGVGKIEIQWRLSPPIGVETSSNRIFQYGGGQLLAINRYR